MIPIKEQTIQALLIEDDPGDVLLLKHVLKNTEVRIDLQNVPSMELAMAAMRHAEFHVILTDLNLYDCDAFTTIKMLSRFTRFIPVIGFSTDGSEAVVEATRNAGFTDFVEKGSEEFRELERHIYSAVPELKPSGC